ncbi:MULTISPECIES: LysE/ArgO family amino acid transporter [Paenibacillus]|uniref:LysE/ArgO family amino acid transporter n=1 Tax=Paenibacillus TaxID=44249 RepID=UPI002280EDF2|nr:MULTISPECIES: LysE/ArgO family amino acid transporter [Paenibacillus]MCY7484650.1 LysE/ArgO family amino acid transporter [Paenibacillus alvei]
MTVAFFHGVALAFGLIIPLGAQNVFVFNQGALQKRLSRALPVILTAALCDTLLILLAVLGVSLVVLQLAWLQLILFGAGLVFLVYMGWSVWKSEPPNTEQDGNVLSAKKQILFALSVSLLNPHAILDTIGVIGTSSLSYTGNEKLVFTAACVVVSWCWFFALAIAGKVVGKLDSNGRLIRNINKISAIIIWAVAIYILKQLIEQLMA